MTSLATPSKARCYFEVKQNGELYALLCSGLNVEIHNGVMVIGGPIQSL